MKVHRNLFSRPLICPRNHTSPRYLSTRIAAPPPSAFAPLNSRALLSLSGPDSTNYLTSAITASLPSPLSTTKTSTYAAFLNAPGRILHDVFIYPTPTGYLLDVDASQLPVLAKHIKRYKLRAKFEVRPAPELALWSAWGEGIGDGHGYEDRRAPHMGRRIVLPTGKWPEIDAQEVEEGVYMVKRYLAGVPEGQDELIRETALPQESNLDYMGAIDYRKGCYVGQELTIRTHHQGVVRKRILPVMLYGVDEPEPSRLEYKMEGKAEEVPKETQIGRFEKRGRSAGKWIGGVGNIGLALCRLEIMTDVKVAEGAGWKEGDEFKLDWEVDGAPETVKIKAFVPEWHPRKE